MVSMNYFLILPTSTMSGVLKLENNARTGRGMSFLIIWSRDIFEKPLKQARLISVYTNRRVAEHNVLPLEYQSFVETPVYQT